MSRAGSSTNAYLQHVTGKFTAPLLARTIEIGHQPGLIDMSGLPANPFTQLRLFIKARASQYEAYRLCSDANTIIKSGEGAHHGNFLENVARELDTNLDLAQEASKAGETRLKVRERLRAIHRETRRRRDEAGLSAATLAIIHIRARELGGAGKPAQDVIDTFRREWGGS